MNRVSRLVLVLVSIAATVATRADPPTLRIVEDIPAETDNAVAAEWRSEVREFRSLLEQVEHVAEEQRPDYTFRQFEISKEGDGEWLSLTHRAWYQSRDDDAASRIRPPSSCESCPPSRVRRLFLETVQAKLFDAEHGLYRPYAVTRCDRDRAARVAITVQAANGLRLEPDILYLVGEWTQTRGKPKRLAPSLISLEPVDPRPDRLHATFEVQAPSYEIRDGFLSRDCTGVPPYPIVLVPRLVMPLATGTRNDKVR